MTVKSLQHSSLRDNVFYRSMLVGNEGFVPSDEDILDEVVLTSSASSVTFSGLDTLAADYKHLQVRGVVRTETATTGALLYMRINNVSTGSYGRHSLRANGTSVFSIAGASQNQIIISNIEGGIGTANAYSPIVGDILDFSSTSKNSTVRFLGSVVDHNATDNQLWIYLSSGFLNSTDAVDSIQFFDSGANNVSAGSRFTLIGLK